MSQYLSSSRGTHSSEDDIPPVLQSFIKTFPKIRPTAIKDLWETNTTSDVTPFGHELAQNLHLWASKEEIINILNDTNQMRSMVTGMSKSAMALGMILEDEFENRKKNGSGPLGPLPFNTIRLASCLGCNQATDNGRRNGEIVYAYQAPVLVETEPAVNESLHKLIMIMTVVCQLMAYPEADSFAMILSKHTDPLEIMRNAHLLHSTEFDTALTATLVGIFDNGVGFSKLNHITSALFSLICARRPAQTLGGLNENLFVPSLLKYLKSTFDRVCYESKCSVDDYFGVCGFINVLPLLYHFGSWEVSHRDPSFKEVVAYVCVIMIHMLAKTAPPTGSAEDDARPSMEQFPELVGARIFIDRMIANEDDEDNTQGRWRKKLLEEHPKSFAIFGAMEVLQWYCYNGVDLRVPLPSIVESTVTVIEYIKDTDHAFYYLIDTYPSLDYMKPIIKAMILGKKTPKPSDTRSLLHGPLNNARKRCGLPSCRKPEAYLRCAGCNRIEFYCCRDHQKKHWKEHKQFCKKFRTTQQVKKKGSRVH